MIKILGFITAHLALLLCCLLVIGVYGFIGTDIAAVQEATTLGVSALVRGNVAYSCGIVGDDSTADTIAAIENRLSPLEEFKGIRYIDAVKTIDAADGKEAVGYMISPLVYGEFSEYLESGKAISTVGEGRLPVYLGGSEYRKTVVGDSLSLSVQYAGDLQLDIDCVVVGKIRPTFRLSQPNQSYDDYINQQKGVVVLPYPDKLIQEGMVANDGLFQIVSSAQIDNINELLADLPLQKRAMTDLVSNDVRAEFNVKQTKTNLFLLLIIPILFLQFIRVWQLRKTELNYKIKWLGIGTGAVIIGNVVSFAVMSAWFRPQSMLYPLIITCVIVILLTGLQLIIGTINKNKRTAAASASVTEGELL